MKKFLRFIFIFTVLLCGCDSAGKNNAFREEIPGQHNNRGFQGGDSGDAYTEETPPATPAPETQQTLPYTLRMKGNTPVHEGPGTEYDFISTIGADGTFTIVEEATDTDGNKWGKLKSGLGWVNISLLGSYTVEKADKILRAFYGYGVIYKGETEREILYGETCKNNKEGECLPLKDGYIRIKTTL